MAQALQTLRVFMNPTRLDTSALPAALAEALNNVSEWDLPLPAQQLPSDVQLIAQGGVHQVYRAALVTQQGTQSVAIRLPADANPMGLPSRMGVTFDAEVANQRLAASHLLAPDIFWSEPHHQVIVMAYCEPNASVTIEDLSHCLRGIHQLSLVGERLDLTLSLERYGQIASARGVSPNSLIDPYSLPLQEAIGVLAREPAVGCHHDLNAANFLSGNGPVAIDWEYAAPGDPYFDIAAASAGNPHIEADALIRAVLGEDYQPTLWHIAKAVYQAVDVNWRAAMGKKVTQGERENLMAYLSEILE